MLVKKDVKSALGEYNCAADFVDQLEKEVVQLVTRAAERAHENGRKTVMARDLWIITMI